LSRIRAGCSGANPSGFPVATRPSASCGASRQARSASLSFRRADHGSRSQPDSGRSACVLCRAHCFFFQITPLVSHLKQPLFLQFHEIFRIQPLRESNHLAVPILRPFAPANQQDSRLPRVEREQDDGTACPPAALAIPSCSAPVSLSACPRAACPTLGQVLQASPHSPSLRPFRHHPNCETTHR